MVANLFFTVYFGVIIVNYFRTQHNLSNKMEVDKPFSCDTCDTRFGGLIEMKRHKEMGKCGLKEEDQSLKIES